MYVCMCLYLYVCLLVSVRLCVCLCDCRVEKSTDQVIKPVNLEALGRWVSSVPADVRRDIHKIAPMLSRLGYDADAYPPSYGQADALVANNTLLLKQNEEYWQHRAQDIFQQVTKVASLPIPEQQADSERRKDKSQARVKRRWPRSWAWCCSYRVRHVLEFKIQIFQAWKIMELRLGPGKSWKINQVVATFLTRVHVFGLYIHYHCPPSDSVQCVV